MEVEQPHGTARPLGVQELKVEYLPDHLTPWKAGGFKAWGFITDGWPLDSTEIDLTRYGGATLPEWLSRTSVQTLNLSYCKSLTALPDLSALTSLQTLSLDGCKSLTALPDSAPRLQTLDLGYCESLTALPDLSLTSLQRLDLRGCESHARPVVPRPEGRAAAAAPAGVGGGRAQELHILHQVPARSTRLSGLPDKHAHLNGRGGTVAASMILPRSGMSSPWTKPWTPASVMCVWRKAISRPNRHRGQ